MKLIVGLGNPGKEYRGTRHNMGFMVVEHLADVLNFDIDREDFHGVYGRFKFHEEDVYVLKPLTYMNLSGQSVKALADYYKIGLEDIIVVYDELALPPGKIRLREKGSSGGHNGIKDIISRFGSEEIKRIRIGIGEPKYSGVDHVLGKPSKEEEKLIEQAVGQAVEAIKLTLKQDFHHAMSKFN